jgi:ABC-2 type transport system ATP-binding protein
LNFCAFYGGLAGLRGGELEKRIEESAALTGLKSDWMDRKLRTFSKGMLQRTGLAQALLGSPRLVIFDEPMSGLDPMGRKEVRSLLKHLHAQGVTVFYSSHVLGDVEAICTRLAMMVNGEVRRCGTVAEVLGEEGKSYAITLAQALAQGENTNGKLPGCTWQENRILICENAAARDLALGWAVQNGHAIESVEHRRPSLEDILTQEVLKAG